MDYEKKIKNALSDKSVPFEVQAWLEEQFPELKRDKGYEDRDILNAIAEGVQYCEKIFVWSDFGGVPIDVILEWIEKQGDVKESLISLHDNKTCKENGNSSSDNERIRKAAIAFVKQSNAFGYWLGVSKEQVIAWLENQAKLVEYYEDRLDRCACENFNKGYKKALEKQGEQALSQTNERDWLYLVCDVLTWKNGVGQYLDDPRVQELAKKLCNEYAQKLTMQKSAKNIAETWKEMRLEVYQQASGNRHEPNCSDDTTKMFSLNDIDEIIEKMSEQKPANKVKPKFKVGDWLQYRYAKPFFVEEITKQGYVNGDSCLPFNWENEIHLWAITDAKDGDVLTTDTWTFIFKKYQDKSVYFHCAVSTFNEFSISDTGNFDSNYIHPASKEQRDKFFAQMKNAGCEWDAEKKELKKIMED